MRFRIQQFVLFLFVLIATCSSGQVRKEIEIPDIPGYFTLKCDFHMHTVFSDGNVWPTIRVTEAWEEGLDAIAITDHIEYLPHSKDIKADHNRAYELSKPLADQLGIMLIRGAEITRNMPPGHLNAIFILNANLLERDDWFEACQEARDQGGFVFWNHPGWKIQQQQTRWREAHTRLIEAGLLQGIEVYNNHEFYPEALRWSDEKNLTMLCNSGIHDPVSMEYDLALTHRPVTLVFAAERSIEAIRLALEDRRTAIYFDQKIMGDPKFLEPIFNASIEIVSGNLNLENMLVRTMYIHNRSDIDFVLKQTLPSVGFSATSRLVLKAHRTTPIEVTGTADEIKEVPVLRLNYQVTNLITGPSTLDCLQVVIDAANF